MMHWQVLPLKTGLLQWVNVQQCGDALRVGGGGRLYCGRSGETGRTLWNCVDGALRASAARGPHCFQHSGGGVQRCATPPRHGLAQQQGRCHLKHTNEHGSFMLFRRCCVLALAERASLWKTWQVTIWLHRSASFNWCLLPRHPPNGGMAGTSTKMAPRWARAGVLLNDCCSLC
jgi:hypothetical protein